MSLLKWFRRSRKVAAPSPQAAASPETKKAARINDALLSAVGQTRRKAPPQSIFVIAKHPPGVGPKDRSMAMDSNEDFTAAQGWANQAFLNSFAQEGLTFLGYAYLAELAQRPEYRMISETLATEMTRKWISFTAKEGEDKADRIAELEAEFTRLKVRDLFCRVTQQDGFFGRGHIYIDTGDGDDPAELQKSIGDGSDKISRAKIKKGSIKALRTVEAVWCYPTSYESNDPLKDNWYRPDSWYVQSKIVHSSRLLTFIGREVPDLLKPTYSFGGLSLSQMAKPYVDNFLRNRESASDILDAFSVFVLLTNMQESLQADGDQLFKRAELFNKLRDNRGLMMIDKDSEDFKNVAAPLSGIGELLTKSQEMMCLPAHAPVVKLWGIQPAGLNADSEGVMRSFYDYILSFQEHFYRDKLHRLKCLIELNLWGETDDAIGFKFEPLWSLDEKGAAEVEKIKADTDQVNIDSGVITPQEARERIANDPDSGYSSLDPDEVPDLLSEEEEGLAPKGGHMLKDLGEEPDGGKLNRMFDKAKEAA